MKKNKLKSSSNSEALYKSKYIKLNYNILFLKLSLFFFINYIMFVILRKTKNNSYILYATKNSKMSKLIKENFFIIDSNNLDNINSHMYGFSVSRKGILTNNYYKKLDYDEEPDPQGVYIMIKKKDMKSK